MSLELLGYRVVLGGRFVKSVFCLLGLGFGLSACAATMPRGTELPVGAAIRAPSGFVEFCQRNTADCDQVAPAGAPVELTKARWQELNTVNAGLNKMIKPETDEQLYKKAEYWTYADRAGDCEDYALTKRRALIELGWPANTLSLATARNERGELHAVLVVVTDHGDLVLDNATNFVEVWNQRPYQWVSLQEPDMPMVWHRAAVTTEQTTTAALN